MKEFLNGRMSEWKEKVVKRNASGVLSGGLAAPSLFFTHD